MATIEFLGAVGTVTGSKFPVDAEGWRLLLDCGLYQGLKELRLRNWARLPVEPSTIEQVVLTHAHIDHSGYLPRLVKDGFQGPVWATRATADLLQILLPDSGHLQEEEAEYHNRRGTGGITGVIEQILAVADKQTGAQVVYEADPMRLVDRLLEVYRTQHYKKPSCFCAEKGLQG